MSKVIGFVDGFNMYHAIMRQSFAKGQSLGHYRWLDYWQLIQSFLRGDDSLEGVYLFTAYADWNPAKKVRHKTLVRVNRDRGVTVVFGKFRRVSRNCRACRSTYYTYEEKRTDVNIAVTMLKLAVTNDFDKAILVSADSDLLPAIRTIKELRPYVQVAVVTPIGLSGQALAHAADLHLRMNRNHLNKAILPPMVQLKDGSLINCPQEWIAHG